MLIAAINSGIQIISSSDVMEYIPVDSLG